MSFWLSRRMTCLLGLSVALLILPASPAAAGAEPAATQPAGGATESIYRDALAWLDEAEGKVDSMIAAAEMAAERLAAGGTLYVAGNSGFADELETRAGGFPFTRPWRGENLGAKDVLLVGCFRPNEMENRHAHLTFIAAAHGRRFGRGMLVHFASHSWPQIGRVVPLVDKGRWGDRLHFVDTGAPHGGSLSHLSLGQMATTVLAWAFSGEVIAAATRKGKMLATYASDWEPNGRAWDASVKDEHVHPKYTVPPQEAGKIGRQYLRICRSFIEEFLKTGQAAQVRLAGARLAACMKRGGMVWVTCDGHIHPRGSLVPRELTGVMIQGRSYDWWTTGRRIGPKDTLLYMGYLRYPRRIVEGALRRGADAVVISVDPGPADKHVTQIRGCWKDWDTVVELPKYPIRVLPASGVVQTLQWYSLMAETLRACKGSPGASPAAK